MDGPLGQYRELISFVEILSPKALRSFHVRAPALTVNV